MYQIEYLPIAQQDMVDIAKYIGLKLSNPIAANKLANELIDATNQLTTMPYSWPVFFPIKSLKHEYRKLIVKNYIIFYWVDEKSKTVTISRIIYAKRDYKLL